ncbi:MAG: hypothetical protein ABFC62_09990 [Clostridiaceae bacterium]|nr:hypothetical protein [Eubacteriales bacterium]
MLDTKKTIRYFYRKPLREARAFSQRSHIFHYAAPTAMLRRRIFAVAFAFRRDHRGFRGGHQTVLRNKKSRGAFNTTAPPHCAM